MTTRSFGAQLIERRPLLQMALGWRTNLVPMGLAIVLAGVVSVALAQTAGSRLSSEGMTTAATSRLVVSEEVAALPSADQADASPRRMREEPSLGARMPGQPQRMVADTAENMRLLMQLMSMIASCDYRCSMSPK